LLNILPQKIAEQLKRDGNPIARSFEAATILFADIVGFTPLAARHSPTVMVDVLNRLFCEFDNLAEQHQLEKIKTIGDSYMAAAGLPEERPDHAAAIANMALDMQAVLEHFSHDLGQPLQLRIGINSGQVVAGVIGNKKFIYDLWGDSVNVAARMESSGEPGQIQVSQATYLLLQNQGYNLEPRGQIEIKGKGLMTTYWLLKPQLAPRVAALV
jgi:adenylate cyclase